MPGVTSTIHGGQQWWVLWPPFPTSSSPGWWSNYTWTTLWTQLRVSGSLSKMSHFAPLLFVMLRCLSPHGLVCHIFFLFFFSFYFLLISLLFIHLPLQVFRFTLFSSVLIAIFLFLSLVNVPIGPWFLFVHTVAG